MSEPANPDDQPETHPRHDFLSHRRRFALNQIKELREVMAGEREPNPVDPWADYKHEITPE